MTWHLSTRWGGFWGRSLQRCFYHFVDIHLDINISMLQTFCSLRNDRRRIGLIQGPSCPHEPARVNAWHELCDQKMDSSILPSVERAH